MSEMNGVSNLLATWVKFTLSRKRIYASNGNTNGLLGKAVCEGLTFLKHAFVCLLNGHFTGPGPEYLKTEPSTSMSSVRASCLPRETRGVEGDFKGEERIRGLSHLGIPFFRPLLLDVCWGRWLPPQHGSPVET